MMMVRLSNVLRSRVRGERSDSGIAMIMVLGTIIVLTALLTAAMGYAMQVQPQARKDQDFNAAMAAAQAGVDDYIAKLNGNDSYWGPGTFIDCANIALAGPVAPSPNSCSWTSATAPGWRNVQLGNTKAGQFHYDVDPSTLSSQGAIRLTSTGKVGKSTRTIQVNVSRGGPTDFLYYTDFEDADPGNTTSYGPSGADTNSCGKSGSTLADYFWANSDRGDNATTPSLRESSANGGPSRACSEITFVSADTLDGAVHFNDTPLITGTPKFLKGYETADPACPVVAAVPYDVTKCMRGSGTPNLNGSVALGAKRLDLVDNSSAFATFPGCVYTGDTRIRFKSDGTMDVWNTGSVGTSLLGPGSPAGTNCGVAANFKPTSASDPTPTGKQNVPVPRDMIIYVKTGAAISSCSPGQIVNGTTSGSTTGDVIPQGTGGVVSDISYFDPDNIVTTQSQTFTRSTASTSTPWSSGALTQAAGSPDPNSDDHPQTFDCGSGNVYIEGTVKGRVTVAAQNNVLVTDNVLLDGATPPAAASGSSMLGLVAANSVVDYHPVQRDSSTATPAPTRTGGSGSCSSSSTVGATPSTSGGNGTSMTCTWVSTQTFQTGTTNYTNLSFPGATSSGDHRYIYGSIQTLLHSFWVQNYNVGAPLGSLSVRGSIAQRWRGAVGTSGGATGFAKDYSYDTRLKFSGPPYFPQWTNSVWGALTTGEIKPAY
jgi:hypothetical protein